MTAEQADVIIIGSGLGGLVAGGLLARYGRRVIICEAHSIPGGAAHGFERQGFHFDSGPSFFSGLSEPQSRNPLRQVLDVLGESLPAVPYDPLGYYHLPEGTLPVYRCCADYQQAIAQFTPQGAQELGAFVQRLLALYEPLRQIPSLGLRPDLGVVPLLLRSPGALVKLLPHLRSLQGGVGHLLDQTVQDPWVRRLVDLECFLLSGLKAADTLTPEVAFVFGERETAPVDYPLGGSAALVAALVRGFQKWGGELRLRTPVARIEVEAGRAVGVTLAGGDRLRAPVVISNATVWDTFGKLMDPEVVPAAYRQSALDTPAVHSFMHLHLGIRAEGLQDLAVHHVVLHRAEEDLTTPGNTCMISIPSVLDSSLAPLKHHVVHAYTLEPWQGWQRDADYPQRKRRRAETLYRALERVIPDIRDRVQLELIGTPLTHQRFLRRHQGTYGPAIAAGQGHFPSGRTPIPGLWRVGDSTLPGIGVPAVAVSGILCANGLVSPQESMALLGTIAD